MRLSFKWLIALMVLTCTLPFIVSCGKKETVDKTDSEETGMETEDENIKTGISFPYEMENGKLIVNSLFQSSVENPDCNNEIEENIASLEIMNQSDEFCPSAEFQVFLQDGREIVFRARDIPPGKKIWAFAVDNQTIEQSDICEKIEGTVEFDQKSMMENQVMVCVEDTAITVQNLTENEIPGLTVWCHCLFEDTYYGGITYGYTMESLPAGGSVTIEADDCYMGTAEVVRISQEN